MSAVLSESVDGAFQHASCDRADPPRRELSFGLACEYRVEILFLLHHKKTTKFPVRQRGLFAQSDERKSRARLAIRS